MNRDYYRACSAVEGGDISGHDAKSAPAASAIRRKLSFPVTTRPVIRYNLIARKVLTELVLASANGH
jgi:hypothetical protein